MLNLKSLNSVALSYETKYILPYNLAIVPLSAYWTKLKAYVHPKYPTKGALFTISES